MHMHTNYYIRLLLNYSLLIPNKIMYNVSFCVMVHFVSVRLSSSHIALVSRLFKKLRSSHGELFEYVCVRRY